MVGTDASLQTEHDIYSCTLGMISGLRGTED